MAPITCDAVELDVNDFITTSAMMYDSTYSGPSPESAIAGTSLRGLPISVGAANASSPAGEPSPQRAVRPLSDEARFD